MRRQLLAYAFLFASCMTFPTAEAQDLKPEITQPVQAVSTKAPLWYRLMHPIKTKAAPAVPPPVPEIVKADMADVITPEKLPVAVTADKAGKVYIIGNPNSAALDRAVKQYKADQIAQGKLPRPWYKPNRADMWRNFRTKVVPAGTLVFSAVGAFK